MLAAAYGIARTMQHDSHYQQLEYIPRASHQTLQKTSKEGLSSDVTEHFILSQS